MKKIIGLSISLLFLALLSTSQVPVMVQDINVGVNPTSVSPSSLYPWNGYLYFFSDDSVHGSELWRYNEQLPPAMVQDYFPGVKGIGGGGGDRIAAYKNKIYFGGDSTFNGTEIGRMYCYDGIGPIQLANSFPLDKFDGIGNLIVIGRELYFTADSASTNFMWRYDGINPPIIIPMAPGTSSGPLPGKLVPYKGKYYFTALSNPSTIQLYELDTTSHTVRPISGVTNIADLITGANLLYLLCTTDTAGIELHSYDGTTFKRLTNITSTVPAEPVGLPMCFFDSSMYFAVMVAGWGKYELGRYDLRTNSYRIVHTIAPDINGINQMMVYKNHLYIVARTPATGFELWKYDGASGSLVADLNPGSEDGLSSYPMGPSNNNSLMTIYNNHLYFRATDGIHGMELWTLNDPTGVQNVIWPAKVSLYPNPTSASATLKFALSRAETLRVSLSDINGKEVYNSGAHNYDTGSCDLIIPMQSLSAGQYFYHVWNQQGASAAAGVITRND